MNTFRGNIPDMIISIEGDTQPLHDVRCGKGWNYKPTLWDRIIEWCKSKFHTKEKPVNHDLDYNNRIKLWQNLYKKVDGEMVQFSSDYYRCKNCGMLLGTDIEGKYGISTCKEDKEMLGEHAVYMSDEEFEALKDGKYNNASISDK